jgi:hypothetical protein
MSLDQQQLSALIDAAVREAVERTTQQLTAKFETDTAGLRRNRDDLLAAKKDGEGKKPGEAPDNFDEWLAGLDERLAKVKAESARLAGKGEEANPFIAPREVTLSREAARSGAAYREAKAEAERLGVPLRIVDANAPAQQQGKRSSPVKFVKDSDAGVLYVNADMIQRHGQERCRQIAAEQGATKMMAFRSIEDLPQPMQQAHAQAMADRSNLLGDQ